MISLQRTRRRATCAALVLAGLGAAGCQAGAGTDGQQGEDTDSSDEMMSGADAGTAPADEESDGPWTDCSQHTFGTMLLCGDGDKCGDLTRPVDILLAAHDAVGLRGMAMAGAPDDHVKSIYQQLPGWSRGFMGGTVSQLQNKHDRAVQIGMGDQYECLSYGPESPHNAGSEALDPLTYVPQARTLADGAGKCLNYGPAVQDYEERLTDGDPADLAALVGQVAPDVDVWTIQLGFRQGWVDNNKDADGAPYSMADLHTWLGQWVSWIKGGNPSADVWVQLGVGKVNNEPGCQGPRDAEYLLTYREALIDVGVDGLWVMVSQPCIPCPPSPPAGFPCSDDPLDHEKFEESLLVLRDAIDLACGQ